MEFKELVSNVKRLIFEKEELVSALRELHDWQNGPPLLSAKWKEGWGNAMAKAEELLRKHEKPCPTRSTWKRVFLTSSS
jgi:hypothetical protein